MASGALQSPFSWTWKPFGPGVCPLMSPVTRTRSLRICVKVTVPVTLEPLAGLRRAVALGPSELVLAHAPSRNAEAARV
jgi:hypothetical protein